MKKRHYSDPFSVRSRLRSGALVLATILAFMFSKGALSDDRDPLVVQRIESPADANSLTPNLVSAGNAVYLSWLARTETGHALRFSRWDGEGFGQARTIHTSDAFFSNWADFASMAVLSDGRLAAHWLEKSGDGSYEYDVFLSLSEDGGLTWSEPVRPHRDSTHSEHGFVSLVPTGGRLAVVWLDGRQYQKDADDNEMALFFTHVDGSSQALGPEVRLDARVCECCQSTMTKTRDGLFVAYRDRSAQEIRDISFVRRLSGQWSEPATLHADQWHITGCPVNGPQADSMLSFGRDFLAVSWFTAADGDPRVQVKLSSDGGATFGDAIRADDGAPMGRVDVVAGDGDAIVAWMERGDANVSEVRIRRVGPDGKDASKVVGRTSSGRASGFPRMARLHRDLFVTWTEAETRSGPSEVRVARVYSEE